MIPISPATKIRWLLDQDPTLQKRAENGEILFGNVDSWLIWNLTGGKAHVTDYSNASRTMLFDINKLCWDEELCKLLNIPMCVLPQPVPSSMVYGTVDRHLKGLEMLEGTPISGSAGDQAAALFGQGCFKPGQAKNTYGTGCFTLLNTGAESVRSSRGTAHVRGLEFEWRDHLCSGGQRVQCRFRHSVAPGRVPYHCRSP